jgi:LPS export ABC transporter protein LptC
MNNIYRLIIMLPIVTLGCTTNVLEENKIVQQIDRLDMNIFSNKGDKIYSVTSPNSKYDKVKLQFNLERTTINIFEGEDIKYIITSNSSKLINNNKIVVLNGDVKLRRLYLNNDYLYGDNLEWIVNKSKFELLGNVKFENKNLILYSSKAIMGKDNIIEFFNPVKYVIKGENNENKYETNSENALYNINTESLIFRSKNERVRSVIYF